MDEFHAPVKFKYVFPFHAKFPLANAGRMNFTVWNLRSSYVFIYISGNTQYPSIIAQSETISFKSTSHPMSYHVAISPTLPNTMLVMWTQEASSAVDHWTPRLNWGLSSTNLEH